MVVIVNPATRGNAIRLVELLRAAAPSQMVLDVHFTERPGHGSELARETRDSATTMVAIGGDGTVSEVAGALRGTGIPLGIVPGGSTNIVAQELGIPTNIRRNVEMLFGSHKIISIDVGICGDKVFLHMAGAGFDSAFFSLTDPNLKRSVGWLAYIPAAVRALTRKPFRLSIETPDRKIEVDSPLVLVANGASIINPRFRLNSLIRNDDGLLNVLVITATTPVQLARVLARLATMQLERSPYLIHLTASEVSIDADPTIDVELDGDVVERTPVMFTVDPRAVKLIVPA
jgi:YegS/Rv2252/BmrU family lipid kinase